MRHRTMVTGILTVSLLAGLLFLAGENRAQTKQPTKLAVLWTSGDPDVAHRVCFMYTGAAKRAGWFDEVRLVVWGPSARLLAGDKDLQAKVKDMIQAGVLTEACKACSDSYGVSSDLSDLGVDVRYMGKPLTEMLQSDWKVLTF